MKIFLKPKEGLKVPRPEDGRFLDKGGEAVEKNSYWQRRIADGSVIVVQDTASSAKAAPAAQAKSDAKNGGKS